MIRPKIILTLAILATAIQLTQAQYAFTAKGLLGSHIYPDQKYLLQDQIWGTDLTVAKNIAGNADEWIQRSNAKSAGLDFVFRDLSRLKGPSDTAANSFGQIYGIGFNAEFELLRLGNIKLRFKPSVGLAYTNKHYFNTPKNRIIGGAFNELIKADLGFEMPLGKRHALITGFSFLHMSNGGATVPNGGLNTGNIYLGVKFGKNDTMGNHKKSDYLPLQRHFIELAGGFGKRGVYEKQNETMLKSGLFAGYGLRINDFIALKAGVDAVHYYDIYNPAKHVETFQYYASSFKNWRVGTSIGADLNLWRITINGQVGKYIYYKRLYQSAHWYWTFGPIFNLTPRLGIQVKTYMHFAQADYVNYGLVYRL